MSLDVYLYKDVDAGEMHRCYLYEANITHNLNKMAEAADIYMELWRPDELGVIFANELIAGLEIGLSFLKEDPEFFKKFNPKNGWGTYEGLVRFVEKYLGACKRYPKAEVEVWR